MTSADQAARPTANTSPDSPAKPLPTGFRFSGVSCGIKKSGKPDVALIVADQPVAAAGMYTRNQIVAAPVILCRKRTPAQSIRAIVANSGNANACTGEAGLQNAEKMCQLVADHVGCHADDVLVLSTGVIGVPLPMDCLEKGILKSFARLGRQETDFFQCADAIRTTDKDRKTVIRNISSGDQTYSIAAMAKGAGMIAPNMATMLAVVVTDAAIAPRDAQESLRQATELSFNRVSVDGHTSTNDTVLLLSSGKGPSLRGDALDDFQQHLNEISIELAKMLVADGEGATHILAMTVAGAETDDAAFTIAKTVVASPLVKTAITGGDPNWGRMVSAAGYADAKIQPERMCLSICGVEIYRQGNPIPFDEAALSATMKKSPEVKIELTVGDGAGKAAYWASDLTTEYVTFNSEYTT